MSRVDYLSDSTQCPAPEAEYMDYGIGPDWGFAGWIWYTETVDLVLIWKVLDGEEQKTRGWEGVDTRRNKVSYGRSPQTLVCVQSQEEFKQRF